MTPTQDHVNSWSALDGKIKKLFHNLTTEDGTSNSAPSGSEITAFGMDEKFKRFVVGDSQGRLRVFNYLSGALMKELKRHENAEILQVFFARTHDSSLIISAATDNVIRVHEDNSLHETLVRREIKLEEPRLPGEATPKEKVRRKGRNGT